MPMRKLPTISNDWRTLKMRRGPQQMTKVTVVITILITTIAMQLKTTKRILLNAHNGAYLPGRSFPEEKWVEIIATYREEIQRNGKCTTRQLAELAKIGKMSAAKAVKFAEKGELSFPTKGRPPEGIGSGIGLRWEHHRFLYDAYLDNPSALREEYLAKFYAEYGIVLSLSFVSLWFKRGGPFPGLFRVTSVFPRAKNSPQVLGLLLDYIHFISSVNDQTHLVFADEKPLKQVDLFRLV